MITPIKFVRFFQYTYLQGPQICLYLIIIYIKMLNKAKKKKLHRLHLNAIRVV